MTLDGMKGRLSARAMATVLVGLFFAAAFVIALLLPAYRAATRLRQDIAELHAEIDLKQKLVPLLVNLHKAEAALPDNLPTVRLEPLPLENMAQLSALVGDLAKESQVRVVMVSPEASSAGKQGFMSVHMRFQGSMEGIHALLLRLGAFGPLVGVQTATTRVLQDGRELTLTCWLSVH